MWIVFLLFAQAVPAQVIPARNPRTSPSDTEAGAKIFRGHCAECHGLQGEGGRGPRLTTGVFFHGGTDSDLHRNITDGIQGTAMPGVFFSEEQVWQIVSYVRSLSARAQRRPPPGDAARGAKLFSAHGCLSCHLVNGEGGAQGPDLSVIGSQRSPEHLREALLDPASEIGREFRVVNLVHEDGAEYTGFIFNEDTYAFQLLDFSRGLTSVGKRDLRKSAIGTKSAMPSYKDRLGAADLDDIVAYLWSLQRRTPPTREPR